jgi:hypothetical protein
MLFVLHSIERISSFIVPAFVTTTPDEGTRLTLYNYSNTLSLSVGFLFLSFCSGRSCSSYTTYRTKKFVRCTLRTATTDEHCRSIQLLSYVVVGVRSGIPNSVYNVIDRTDDDQPPTQGRINPIVSPRNPRPPPTTNMGLPEVAQASL